MCLRLCNEQIRITKMLLNWNALGFKVYNLSGNGPEKEIQISNYPNFDPFVEVGKHLRVEHVFPVYAVALW